VGSPDEIEFGALGQSGTKSPKFCRYSFPQDSSRVTMITEGRTELASFHCYTIIY